MQPVPFQRVMTYSCACLIHASFCLVIAKVSAPALIRHIADEIRTESLPFLSPVASLVL